MNTFRIARRPFAMALILSLLLALLPAGALAASTGDGTTEVLPLAVSQESGFIASGSCGDDIQWQLSSLGDLVLIGTGAMEDYATASACPWYSHRQSIKTVEISDGITSVGDRAFYNCEALSQVTLGGDVTTVGTYAFRGCTSLVEITIPASVTQLKASAFRSCTALKTVRMEGPAPTVGNYVFTDCAASAALSYYDEYSADYGVSPWTGFSHVPMHTGTWVIATPATCTTPGSRYLDCTYCRTTITEAFTTSHTYENGVCASCGEKQILASGRCGNNVSWSLDGLGILTISGNSSMWNYSFWDDNQPWRSFLTEITEVIVGKGVTSIGNDAFYNCSSLTSITIPESVTGIGDYAFGGCSSLTSITIPESVTSIGDYAFLGCSSLTSITIPESVTSIGNFAFPGCSSLTSITIPESVTSIGYISFSGCSSLTSFTIPEGVTVIGEGAFSGCSSLTSITIPEGVTYIGDYAFRDCSSLTSITIPESLTSIGYWVFNGCSSLWHVLYTGTEEQWDAISIRSYNSDLTSATRHYNAIGNEISSVVSKEPTCAAEGVRTTTCSICNEMKETPIPKLAHTFGDNNLCVECGSGPDIIINLQSYYGDGWNGCAIEIYEDGQLVTTVTISSGSSKQIKIPWFSNKSYSFKWIEGGEFSDCSFEISHKGEILASGYGEVYTNGQTIYTIESIPTPEYETITGSIIGFGEGEVTLTLTEAGKDQPLNTVTTSGQNYSLDVLPGTYILTVSKPNHVTRQYTITVGTEPVSLDVKICLIGDINGDGKINVVDTSKAYAHVKGGVQLTDYAFACGDIDGNGKINVADISKIYGHIKDTKSLW